MSGHFQEAEGSIWVLLCFLFSTIPSMPCVPGPNYLPGPPLDSLQFVSVSPRTAYQYHDLQFKDLTIHFLQISGISKKKKTSFLYLYGFRQARCCKKFGSTENLVGRPCTRTSPACNLLSSYLFLLHCFRSKPFPMVCVHVMHGGDRSQSWSTAQSVHGCVLPANGARDSVHSV